MGLDLQPDGLTAGLAGYKFTSLVSERKRNDLYVYYYKIEATDKGVLFIVMPKDCCIQIRLVAWP